MPPGGADSGMYVWGGDPGEGFDNLTLQRLYLTPGMGTPRVPPGGTEGSGPEITPFRHRNWETVPKTVCTITFYILYLDGHDHT